MCCLRQNDSIIKENGFATSLSEKKVVKEMRRLINYILIMMVLTFSILFSYGKIQNKVKTYTFQEIYDYVNSYSIWDSISKE